MHKILGCSVLIVFLLVQQSVAEAQSEVVMDFTIDGQEVLVCSEIDHFSTVEGDDVSVFVVKLAGADVTKFGLLTEKNLGKTVFISVGELKKKIYVKTPIYSGTFMFSVPNDEATVRQWTEGLELLRKRKDAN